MAKIIKNVWDYFRNSWEGEDQKFSYRRFSQYVFLSLVVFLVLTGQTQTSWGFYTMITLLLSWMLVVTLITAQQLIILLKYTLTIKKKQLDVTETAIINDSDVPPELLANPDGVPSTQLPVGE